MSGAVGRETDVSVITSGHDIADARLHREVAGLRARGLTVEVLGLGRLDQAPEGVTARVWDRRGVWGRALLAARLPLVARGRVLMSLDPDSGLAACVLGRLRGRRVVVDVHEDYAALLGDRAWARRHFGLPGMCGQAVVGAALRLFRYADLVVVADEHVPPQQASRRLVVRNLPDTSMLPEPSPRDSQPRALYIGDLRASRGLFAMVEAVRRAPGWGLDLVGPVAPGDEERLKRLFDEDPELAARVRLHGRQPPARAWQYGRGAWVGLLLLEETPAFRDAVPSKLFEYLACGLPVITTDLPRQSELVRQDEAGEIVRGGTSEEVAEQVAEVLRRWSGDPGSVDLIRERLADVARARRSAPTPYDELAEAIATLVARSRQRVLTGRTSTTPPG